MSHAAPEGAFCLQHPAVHALWACGRCGAFFCRECECRTRPDALPMCPACWTLRGQRVVEVAPGSGTRLQTAGLVVGCFAILPLCPLQIVSIVLNIVALVKAKEPPASTVRWKPILGLALTGVGLVIWVIVIAAAGLK